MQLSYQSGYSVNRGFTLLEILVATVILFSAIAAVSLVYRGALLSSDKAKSHIILDSKVPLILTLIQDEIRNNATSEQQLSGADTTWNVSYRWQANLESYKPPQPLFSPESGTFEEFAPKFKLWQVKVEVEHEQLIKEFSYKELSW